MAILQSNNGQFYQVPDEEAEKFLVPADKVEETLRTTGVAQQPQHPQPCCAPGAPAGAPMRLDASTVIIYVGGSGPPHVMQAGAGPQGQVQGYAGHGGRGGHGGHHGGGGWGWWGFGTGLALGAAAASYNNYSNYQNYNNYGGW